ncbi:MAG: 4Fe-4S binding protein [Anaerolineales bacterium]|nr:4Fe-4S binding protein [Anaerolineales bacterium]
MYVNEARCTGCGACLQVCPSDAIRLVNNCAQIDAVLCNDCRTCVEVCPSDAIITAVPAIVPAAQIAPVVETKMVPARSRVVAPAVGAALTFLGREVAPRVASAVVETMLNRAAERTRLQSTPSVRANRPRRLRRRAGRSDR